MSSSRNVAPNLISGGTIAPSVLVKLSTSADNTCLQAVANDKCIGISQPGTRDPQGVSSNTYAAASGDTIELFGLGDICNLTAGTGGWTRGDLLVSDANGNGITAATDGTLQNIAAIALESTTAGQLGRVQIVLMYDYTPGTSDFVPAVWQQDGGSAPSAGSQTIFLATRAYTVSAVSVVFGTASTSGTVDVKKDTGTTAPGGGTSVLTGTISLAGTANTVVNGTLTATAATLAMAAGDRLSVTFGGTLTSLANAVIQVALKPK